MRKTFLLLLFLFLSFVITGCNTDELDNLDDPEDNEVRYTQVYRMNYIEPVALFDSVYPTENGPNGYIKKETIFDREKIEQLRLGQIGIHSSTSDIQNVFPEEEGVFMTTHHFSYIKNKYIVEAYGAFDFSSYLSNDFILNIQALENDEISPQDIFNQYGTHMVMSVLEGVFYSLELEIDSVTLSRDEMHSLLTFLSSYKKDRYTVNDLQSFEEMSKKANVSLSLESNLAGDNYMDLIDKLNSGSFEYEMFFEFEGCLTIWNLVPKEYSKSKGLLEEAYNTLQTNKD